MTWIPILYIYIISVLLLCALVMAFFKRTRRFSIIPFVLGLILNFTSQSVPINLFVKNEQKGLSIMTYNMNSASEYFKSVHENPREMVDFIVEQNADIVILEECYSMYCEQSFYKLMSEQYPYVNMQQNGCPNLVYSKFPLGRLEELRIAEGEPPAFVEALERYDHKVVHERNNVTGMFVYTPIDSLYLLTCHLTSNGYDTIRSVMNENDSWISGIPAYVESINKATDSRCIEAKAIVQRASALYNNNVKVIVAGDMNDVAGSRTIKTLQKDGILCNAWWEKGCGLGLTFHGHGLMHFRLDHFLHTNNIKLNGIRGVEQKYSDHDPVVAYFEYE